MACQEALCTGHGVLQAPRARASHLPHMRVCWSPAEHSFPKGSAMLDAPVQVTSSVLTPKPVVIPLSL